MRKKKPARIKTIDNHFQGKKAIDMSEFPSLFRNYILEWTNNNYSDLFEEEVDLNYYQLYSSHVGVKESVVADLAHKPMSYIPSAVLNDMGLGIQIAEVEITYTEEKHALVRLID